MTSWLFVRQVNIINFILNDNNYIVRSIEYEKLLFVLEPLNIYNINNI